MIFSNLMQQNAKRDLDLLVRDDDIDHVLSFFG